MAARKTAKQNRTKLLRDLRCLRLELACVSYYRDYPRRTPDGSFMRTAFNYGYRMAIKDAAKQALKETV